MHLYLKRPKGVRYRQPGPTMNLSDKLCIAMLTVLTNSELRILKRNIDVLLKDPHRKPRI